MRHPRCSRVCSSSCSSPDQCPAAYVVYAGYDQVASWHPSWINSMVPTINAILDGPEKGHNQLLLDVIKWFLVHSLFWLYPNSDRDVCSHWMVSPRANSNNIRCLTFSGVRQESNIWSKNWHQQAMYKSSVSDCLLRHRRGWRALCKRSALKGQGC